MSFLFPAVLGGLAAISIPVAIHLLNKFRVRRIDWGAMRFLMDSLRKNERRVKIEDLILLILRCLLFALLVLAFARPVLKALSAGAEGTGPVAAVVLLDNSASMRQSHGATTRFDEAKKAVKDWADKQESSSLAALFLVSNRTEALVAKPTADFSAFRKALEGARPTDRGTDLAQGIRLAYQELVTLSGRPREIRVYTDDQSSAWSRLEEVRKLAADNPEIRLIPVVVGKQGEDNLGVIGLRAVGGIPAAKMPSTFRVEVGNYGSAAAEGVRLALSVDGAPSASDTIIPRIGAGATQAVDLPVSFADPGHHVVTASISPDALTVDNERTAVVDVVSHMNALIVEGGEAETKTDRDGYFLANALVPLPRDRMLQYYLGVTFTTPAGLDKTSLSEADIVFLSNVGDLPPATAEALKAYVSAGGSLVIFPGALTDPERWKNVPALWDMLPATMGAARTPPDGAKFLAWQSSDLEHPVSALWNDPSQGSLGSIHVAQYFPLTLKTPADGAARPSVIVRLSNGDPAAVEWAFGKGRVVLFNSSATPDWNNLALHPAFVPLVQRLLGYLNRRNEARLILAPGDSFRATVDPDLRGKEFSVQEPDGSRRVAGRVELEGDEAVIRYSGTQSAGAYRIYAGQNETPVAAFAVQVDPRESDLRQLEPSELESLSNPPAEGGVKKPASQWIVTHEFWTTLIWVAAVLALVEMTLAFRFSQAR